TVRGGGTTTVSYTVANQGGTNASSSQAEDQIRNPSVAGVPASAFPTSAINAYSSVSESHAITIPAGSVAGTYNAYVIVDNNSEEIGRASCREKSAVAAFTVQISTTRADLDPQNVTGTRTTVTAVGARSR